MIYFQTHNGHTIYTHHEFRYYRKLGEDIQTTHVIPSVTITQTPLGLDEDDFEQKFQIDALRRSRAMKKRWIREISAEEARAVNVPRPTTTVHTGTADMASLRPKAPDTTDFLEDTEAVVTEEGEAADVSTTPAYNDVTDKTAAASVLTGEYNVQASMLQNDNGNIVISKVREVAEEIGVSFPNL